MFHITTYTKLQRNDNGQFIGSLVYCTVLQFRTSDQILINFKTQPFYTCRGFLILRAEKSNCNCTCRRSLCRQNGISVCIFLHKILYKKIQWKKHAAALLGAYSTVSISFPSIITFCMFNYLTQWGITLCV